MAKSILDSINSCINEGNEKEFDNLCRELDSLFDDHDKSIKEYIDEKLLVLDEEDDSPTSRYAQSDSDATDPLSKEKLFIDGKEKTLEDTLHDINAAVNPAHTRSINTTYTQNSVIKHTQKLVLDLDKRAEEAPKKKRLAEAKERLEEKSAGVFAATIEKLRKGQQTTIGIANKTSTGIRKVASAFNTLPQLFATFGARGSWLWEVLQGVLIFAFVAAMWPAIKDTLEYIFKNEVTQKVMDYLQHEFPLIHQALKVLQDGVVNQWDDYDKDKIGDALNAPFGLSETERTVLQGNIKNATGSETNAKEIMDYLVHGDHAKMQNQLERFNQLATSHGYPQYKNKLLAVLGFNGTTAIPESQVIKILSGKEKDVWADYDIAKWIARLPLGAANLVQLLPGVGNLWDFEFDTAMNSVTSFMSNNTDWGRFNSGESKYKAALDPQNVTIRTSLVAEMQQLLDAYKNTTSDAERATIADKFLDVGIDLEGGYNSGHEININQVEHRITNITTIQSPNTQ